MYIGTLILFSSCVILCADKPEDVDMRQTDSGTQAFAVFIAGQCFGVGDVRDHGERTLASERVAAYMLEKFGRNTFAQIAQLREENERLRQENVRLSEKLGEQKKNDFCS